MKNLCDFFTWPFWDQAATSVVLLVAVASVVAGIGALATLAKSLRRAGWSGVVDRLPTWRGLLSFIAFTTLVCVTLLISWSFLALIVLIWC